MGEWRYSFTILELVSRWRWVVSFKPRPLTPREIISRKNWIGGWVGPDPVLTLWGREILAPAGDETPGVQPVALHHTDWAIPTSLDLGMEGLTVGLFHVIYSTGWGISPYQSFLLSRRIPEYFMFPSWLGTKKSYSLIRALVCCRSFERQDPGSSATTPKSQVNAVQGTNLEQR
jgi:hypothetical protein